MLVVSNGIRHLRYSASAKMLNLWNHSCHVEFLQKLKVLFISKTVKDRVISSKFKQTVN